jgi:hypothetical protein
MNMMQKFSIKYLKAKFNNKIKKRKDHLSWPCWFYSREARMVQHTQINKCKTERKQNQGKKRTHYHLKRCRKSLWQNSTFLHDKNLEKSSNRRNIPQHNKGCIW